MRAASCRQMSHASRCPKCDMTQGLPAVCPTDRQSAAANAPIATPMTCRGVITYMVGVVACCMLLGNVLHFRVREFFAFYCVFTAHLDLVLCSLIFNWTWWLRIFRGWLLAQAAGRHTCHLQLQHIKNTISSVYVGLSGDELAALQRYAFTCMHT